MHFNSCASFDTKLKTWYKISEKNYENFSTILSKLYETCLTKLGEIGIKSYYEIEEQLKHKNQDYDVVVKPKIEYKKFNPRKRII